MMLLTFIFKTSPSPGVERDHHGSTRGRESTDVSLAREGMARDWDGGQGVE